MPAWFEPRVVVMERDEEMIASLVNVANELWERVNDV
jgi:hypothetical protein